MKIMTFHLAGAEYAVELATVVAAVGAGDATELADDDAVMVNGRHVPLLDPDAWLGAMEVARGQAPILVLHGGGRDVALRVDRFGEVEDVADSALRSLPRYFESPVLRGVMEVEGRMVGVIDGERLIEVAGASPGTGERQ